MCLLADGRPPIDNWTDHEPTDDSGTETRKAGRRYDVRLDLYENTRGTVAGLHRSHPG